MMFSGVTILQGGRISHFPIDFCMGLTTMQRYYTACDDVAVMHGVLATAE